MRVHFFFAGASQSFSLGAKRVARSGYITPWLQAASYGHMAIWPGESAGTSSAYGKIVLSACPRVHLYAYAPLHLPTGLTLSTWTTCAPSDRTPAARLELTLYRARPGRRRLFCACSTWPAVWYAASTRLLQTSAVPSATDNRATQ